MIHKVHPITECQICFDNVLLSEIENLKCSANEKHNICKECVSKEKQRRNENNIKYNNECFICRPFEERIEHVTININNNLIVNIDDESRNIPTATEIKHIKYNTIIIMIPFLYMLGVLQWNLYHAIINCIFNDKSFSDHNMEWNPNILYILVAYAILGYIILSSYIVIACLAGCHQDYSAGYCPCSPREARIAAEETRQAYLREQRQRQSRITHQEETFSY